MSQTTYIRFFFLFFLTLIYFLININFFDFYVYRLFESCDFQYSPAKLLLQKKDVFKIYFSSDLASTVQIEFLEYYTSKSSLCNNHKFFDDSFCSNGI